MVQDNQKVKKFVNIKTDLDTKDILNKLKANTKCKNINSIINKLILLSETKFKVERGESVETVQLLYLGEKLKNGWIIKGIDAHYINSLNNP